MENPKTRRFWAVTLTGLLLTLGIPFLPLTRWLHEFDDTWHLIRFELVWWALTGSILVWVRFIEPSPLSTLGFRRFTVKDSLAGLAAAVFLLAGLAGIYYWIFPALGWSDDAQVSQLRATPLWWRLLSTLRAAVSEEVLFRGYALQRIRALTGRWDVAAVASCLPFAAAHVSSWGWAHILPALFGGIVLTLLFLWRRNTWVNIGAHFLVDLLAVLG